MPIRSTLPLIVFLVSLNLFAGEPNENSSNFKGYVYPSNYKLALDVGWQTYSTQINAASYFHQLQSLSGSLSLERFVQKGVAIGGQAGVERTESKLAENSLTEFKILIGPRLSWYFVRWERAALLIDAAALFVSESAYLVEPQIHSNTQKETEWRVSYAQLKVGLSWAYFLNPAIALYPRLGLLNSLAKATSSNFEPQIEFSVGASLHL